MQAGSMLCWQPGPAAALQTRTLESQSQRLGRSLSRQWMAVTSDSQPPESRPPPLALD